MGTSDLNDTLRALLRVCSIYFFLALLFFLDLSDIPLPGSGIVRPAFLLVGVYFWSITKPGLLPAPLVFLIGLAFDLVSASAIGLHTFTFMLVAMILRSQRRYLLGQSWPVLWVGFGIATVILATMQTLAFAVGSGTWPSLLLPVAEVVITLLSYPLLTPLMAGLNRFLTVAKQDYT